jgi:hypothetical protein
MNYAFVLRNDGKPRSARAVYEAALAAARGQHGAAHPAVEQVKYEFTSFLVKFGRDEEAVSMLQEFAEALLVEADRLEKEAPAEGEQAAAAEGAAAEAPPAAEEGGAGPADPGTGLEHIEALEGEAAAAPEEALPLYKQARHFAMRNLMNAAGLMDARGRRAEAEATLQRGVLLAVSTHGEKSVPHMNALFALGAHHRRHGALEEAIAEHEAVLNMMDDTITTYEPELLQSRVAILRDTAMLYEQAGDPVVALDYAQGALVNAQTLARLMAAAAAPGSRAAVAGMLEPFYLLLAGLKAKVGDAEGAAEARREALRGKLNQAGRGGRGRRSTRAAPTQQQRGRGRRS